MLISITTINLIIGQANIEGLLNKAEQHYQVNEYKQAKLYYEEYMKKKGNINAAVYHNLGNVYYKNNQLGLALVNYKRGLRFNPRDKDLLYNFKIAKSHVLENAINKVKPEQVIQKGLSIVSVQEWFYLLLGVIVILNIFLTLFYKNKKIEKIKVGLFTALGILIGVLILLTSTIYIQFLDDNAFVISKKVAIKSGPSVDFSTLFYIHDGALVKILDHKKAWVLLECNNRLKGWVEKQNIEKI